MNWISAWLKRRSDKEQRRKERQELKIALFHIELQKEKARKKQEADEYAQYQYESGRLYGVHQTIQRWKDTYIKRNFKSRHRRH